MALAEHLAHAIDRRDRCPQLVADDAGERLAELLRALSGAIPLRDVDRAGECLGHRCDQPLVRVREPRRRRGLELDQPERFVAPDDRGAEPRAGRARSGRAATTDIVDAHRTKLADHRPARARPLRDARTAGTAPPVPGRGADDERVALDERHRTAAELDDVPEAIERHPQHGVETRFGRRSRRNVEHELGRRERPAGLRLLDVGHQSVDSGRREPSAGLRHAGIVAAPCSAPIRTGRLMTTLLGSQPARRGAVDAEG